MHNSVFLREAIDALSIKKGGKYIDATYGVGGHTNEIVRSGGQVLAIDLDPTVKTQEDDTKLIVHGNFAEIKQIAEKFKWIPVDGVIFDLGLSMEQLGKSKKGFSYKNDEEPLDMRISGTGVTAADVLNSFSEVELEELIPKYSEEIEALKIVKKIVAIRKNKPVMTVGALKEVINSVTKRTPYDVYSRIFQALRIVVNDEINNLRSGLTGAFEIIGHGGRIVVITFHSIEDREVKRTIAKLKNAVETRVDVRKQRILAPYEKSARLRIIQKNEN